MKQLCINGKWFGVVEKNNDVLSREYVRCKCIHTLYDFYKKPSKSKQLIWNDLKQWFYNSEEVKYMGILSANVYMFTVIALAEVNEIPYALYITKTNQIAVPINK